MVQKLTPRERDVLYGLADGLSNREIAESLTIEVSTVKWYNRQIYKKLDVSNAREAVYIARQEGLLLREDGPALSPSHRRPARLVGRAAELRRLQRLLQMDAPQLITLVGLGGVGKTTLATYVFYEYAQNFPGGHTFIELGDGPGKYHLFSTLANVFENPDLASAHSEAVFVRRLAGLMSTQPHLLILDNADHFLPDLYWLANLLVLRPQLKIIVTCREPLQLSMETVVMIDGLPHEPLRDGLNDSQTLFLKEAARVAPGAVCDDDLQAVGQICTLLGGLPLAIVLAAGWLRVLPVQEIAEQLEDTLSILKTTHQDRPPRHQSLHHILEMSWQKLTPGHQQMLLKLASFQAHFTRHAFVSMAGGTLGDLRLLIDKSLVQHQRATYTMHPVVHHFVKGKLRHHPGRAAYRRAFAGYVLQSLAMYYEGAQPGITSEDVTTAWVIATEHTMYDALYEAVMGLSMYYSGTGQYQLAIRHLNLLLDVGDDTLRLRAYPQIAWFYHISGQMETATQMLQQFWHLASQVPGVKRVDQAFAMFFDGMVAITQGELATGIEHLQAAKANIPPVQDNVLETGINLGLAVGYLLSQHMDAALAAAEAAQATSKHRAQQILSCAYLALIHAGRGNDRAALDACKQNLVSTPHPYRHAAAYLISIAALALVLFRGGYTTDAAWLKDYVTQHEATQVFIPPIMSSIQVTPADDPPPAMLDTSTDTPLPQLLPQLYKVCQVI